MQTVLARGLENVLVAETELSDVDGERGRLTLRGHSVEELAPRATFEDAVYLMWQGILPSAPEREAARAALAAGRMRAFQQLNSLGDALLAADAMDGLKAGLAHLQPAAEQEDWSLVGATAVFASAWWRLRQGGAPVAPDPALTHTADYLH
ncbi:MAG TPA: citrate/2-methylcitrate synthase, partial [Chloroflexota bacterium]|nr:citrate/2-methylcitrate synthase [Chloroflexota bacterium]